MTDNRDSIIKTAVDMGNMKIKAVTGELSADGENLKILGYVEVPSRGMKKSVVENPEELSHCLAYALGQLREQTGISIEKRSIGISGEAIKSRTTNVRYSFDEKEIGEKEVDTLIRMAEHELLTGKERVLKREIYNIRVNNSGIIKNPIGVTGKEMQGDVHLIYIDEAEAEKLVEVVNRIGLEAEHVLLNAYASAKASLDDEDRRMGVALIDIGEGSTDIILFKNDKLIYSKSLPLGGMHYVNDISYLFQISKQEAFEILSKLKDKDIHEDHIFCGDTKKVSVADIKNIIDARTEDIISFITQTIEESGFNGYLEKINKKTGYVVRKVLPHAFRGLEDVDASMATVIGIFSEIMEEEYNKMQSGFYSQQNESEDPSKIVTEEAEEDDLDKLLEDEKNSSKKKSGTLSSIKNWFSNFI